MATQWQHVGEWESVSEQTEIVLSLVFPARKQLGPDQRRLMQAAAGTARALGQEACGVELEEIADAIRVGDIVLSRVPDGG